MKDSAFLGGAGKGEPTIVTPKQCTFPSPFHQSMLTSPDKTRFRTAMERFYFPSVPDRWTKIGAEDPAFDEEAITTN